MKRGLQVFGVLLILTGGVWILQGVNVLPGSFMSGQMQWTYYGIGTAILGAGMLWFANRRN
jgi:hypothetical protein